MFVLMVGIASLITKMDILGSSGGNQLKSSGGAKMHYPSKNVVYILLMTTCISEVDAACPGCFGNINSCTYDTDGKCPSINIPAINAGIVAGVAAIAVSTVTLSLTGIISTRFLRMFSRAHLQTVMQLIRRPAPGSLFQITKTTKLSAILSAVKCGQVTMDDAAISFAEFIDEASTTEERVALTEKYKLITSTKDLSAFGSTNAMTTDTGVFSWLWGKITNFVADRGMQVLVDAGTGSSSTSTSVLTTTIKRGKDSMDFFEGLNLFIMFCTALGLCTAVAITEFLEFTVFDTIRMRGKPWQLAHELFVVMLRRIEDSAGKLTLVNCINETHLNTVIDEATESAKHHYGAVFFRTRGGTPQDDDARAGGAGSKYNGKFSANSKEPCFFFNAGKTHPADGLHPDGTCKRNHVCDKYVSDKGPGGRCMGTAGTAGHIRDTCDNPRKSNSKLE